MKSFFYLTITLALSGCTSHYQAAITPASNSKKPKNIILMIGDGMGLTQISAGLYANHNKLNLELFPYVGLHKSYPAENGNLITDSAAGATAFSAGEKTYNAAIGVGVDSLPRKTILEMAEEHGLATGLIATCNITHATPGSFIAHVKKRDMFEAIAADFLKTNVDLVIGGGKKYFDRRADNRNLLTEWQQKGYYVSNNTQEDLERMIFPESNVAYFTAEDHPVPAAQGRDYLPLASRLGCDFLKKRNPKGFFMMIEGSQIDWGGHANKSDYIISEMQDFDQAIGQVLDFAKKEGNTLVIVTADHETGGYSINKGSKMGSIQGAFTTDYHTGCLIPVFAFGPGAENFAGMYENTAIFHKMKALFGF